MKKTTTNNNIISTSKLSGCCRWIVKTMMIIFVTIFIFVGMLNIFGLNQIDAYATDYGDAGYANLFMSGDESTRGGWDGGILADVDPSIAGTTSESLVVKISNFFRLLSILIMAFAFVFCVARFVFRGIYMLTATPGEKRALTGGNNQKTTEAGNFILTAKERADGHAQAEWVVPMFKECLMYFGIAICIGLIIGGIASLAEFLFEGVLNGKEIDYSLGGIEVTTK